MMGFFPISILPLNRDGKGKSRICKNAQMQEINYVQIIQKIVDDAVEN